jgi:hypothetical protein
MQRKLIADKGFRRSDRLGRLFAAGARATSLGIALLDSETRFELVNASLACETKTASDHHIGKSSREIVGDLATQIEPTYEKVLRTAKPASVLLKGHVRETPEFGYWHDYCFPIVGSSGTVQQLGLFVVNVTAEKAAREIFDALTTDPKRMMAEADGMLAKFDKAITYFHSSLRNSLMQLAWPFTEAARKTDRFRSSIEQLDSEIEEMRELIYAIISQFSIPSC